MSNLPSRRAYRAGVIAIGLLAVTACSADRPYSRPVDPALLAQMKVARGLEDEGRATDAEQIYRDVVRTDADLVAAHRALQNLEIAEHRRGELLVRYRAFRDASPEDGDRWYLYGRLLTDASTQREA